MKNVIKVLILALLISAIVLILYACTPPVEDEPQEATIKINSAEDFNRMRDMIGYKYSKTTFELTTDIDLSSQNWLVPIGRGATPAESFMGIVDGKGKTITYKIDIPVEDYNLSDEPVPDKVYGLFGYAYNAEFKDLNLVTTINVPTDAENTTIGALCAVINNGAKISNVNVTGNIASQMPSYEKGVGHEEVYNTERNNLIVGGAIGYIKGHYVADNVISSANIQINMQAGGGKKDFILSNLMVGGVFGISRTEDVSNLNTVVNTANKMKFNGEIKAVGSKVLSGGIFGSVHYTNISQVDVELENNFNVEAFKRMSFGGVSGLLENSKLTSSKVITGAVDVLEISAGDNVAFELGGVVGKTKNSEIDTVYAKSELYIGDATYFYGGGIAGLCMDSKISNVATEGGLIFTDIYGKKTSIVDKVIGYSKSDEAEKTQVAKNTKSGGIAGEISGQSVISGKVASEFKAYYPVASSAVKRLEIKILKKGEEALDSWIKESKYNRDLMIIELTDSPDAKEDEQQYTINHFPFIVDDADITYRNDNAKVIIDQAKWEAQNQDFVIDVCVNLCNEGKYLECVTVAPDTTVFEGVKAEIIGRING
ncbi:MAG TPA: hypothetical protein PKX91_01285 [Clostridia bacterium]|jgi:hypothetical protein|nr:hypothetical protein [Clostridia bacterium]